MVEATELGRDLARRGVAFIERCLRDDEQFHARIMAELDRAEAGDVQAVKVLVSAWKDLLSMTRINHGLDRDPEQHPKTLVQVQCVSVTDSLINVSDVEPEGWVELPDIGDLDS